MAKVAPTDDFKVPERRVDEVAGPGLHPSDGTDVVICAAAAQIPDFAEHQRASRELQNSRAPIAQLAPETLLHAIKFAVAEYATKETGRYPQIAASHVCRRWRCLLLDDPSLWTGPDFRNQEVARAMIARARDLPLDATLHFDMIWKLTVEEVVDMIKGSAGLRSLKVIASAPIALFFLNSLSALPLLERLSINNSARWFGGLRSQLLEEGEFPSLRSLTLSCCFVPWRSRVFENITKLTLIMSDFEVTTKQVEDHELIPLLNLEEMHIVDDLIRDQIQNLLAVLVTPRLADFTIDSAQHDSESHEQFSLWLTSWLEGMGVSLSKLEVKVALGGYNGRLLNSHLVVLCEGNKPSDGFKPVKIEVSLSKEHAGENYAGENLLHFEQELEHLVSELLGHGVLFEHGELFDLEDLAISICPGEGHLFAGFDWLWPMSDLLSLKQLKISEGKDLTVLDGLRKFLREHVEEVPIRFPFPELESFKFVARHFNTKKLVKTMCSIESILRIRSDAEGEPNLEVVALRELRDGSFREIVLAKGGAPA